MGCPSKYTHTQTDKPAIIVLNMFFENDLARIIKQLISAHKHTHTEINVPTF